ncbi:MAG TPA: pitrilysin family protein, partial [Gemmatimonadaceae bacterium]
MTAVSSPPDSGLRTTELSNGLTVLSEHMPGVRSVAFGAWVRAASVHESRERMGVSHLLEHMVFKGTRNRSSREIALSLEVLGGSLDAYTAREHTSYQARVLDEHLVEAVDVIGDLMFRPLLRLEDLLLERKVVLEEIGMVDDTPDDLVFELHNEQLWGSHPYGHSILGTRETVSALGVKELKELHARAYHPSQIVVACSGNVVHEQLIEALERTGWGEVARGDATPLAVPPA